MNLQELITNLLVIRAEKAAVQAELKEANEMEDEAERAILDAMDAAGVEAVKNGDAHVRKTITQQPQLENYEDFMDYVLKNDAFDMLQKRLSAPAVRERWEAGEVVPGVTAFTKVGLTVRVER